MKIIALTRTSAPAVEPVSLTLAKQHLRVENTDEDELIGEYISSARAWVESFLERSLIRQTWQMILDGFPDDGESIEMRMPPSYDLQTFTYFDADDDEQDVDVDSFTTLFNVDCGLIGLNAGYAWPVVSGRPGPVRITYRTGYGTDASSVPADIRRAVRTLVEHQYRTRGPLIIGTIASPAEFSVASDLAQHKVWRMG